MSRIDDLIQELCPDGVRYGVLGDLVIMSWGNTSLTKSSYVAHEKGFTAYSATGPDGFVTEFEFDQDGIVLSAIGARCGKTWFASGKWTCIKNTIYFYSIDESLILNKFLYWITFGESFWPRSTSAQPFISLGDSRKLRIPIPPLEVQREIVSILDKFTDLEAELEAELEARKHQRTYVIHALGRGTLPQLRGARKVQLKELVHFENGKPHETLVDPEGQCELITSKFISSNGTLARRINPEDIRTPTFINDIPIVLSDLPNGRALAKCFFVKRDNFYAVNQRIAILRSKDNSIADPEFLYHYVNRNPQILRFDNGSTQTHLKQSDVVNMSVLLPDIEVQRQIAGSLTKLETFTLSMSKGLPAEIAARRKQYEYYRDQLLTFKELKSA